jgi:hypothetical protein
MTDDPMSRCPRLDRCSAPLCPLDLQRPRRSHLRGEAVCAYLRELVKAGGPVLVRRAMAQDLFELIAAAAAELTAPASPVYWPLQVASRKKSQLASGEALGNSHSAPRHQQPNLSSQHHNGPGSSESEGVGP